MRPLETLLYWVEERERIRIKKEEKRLLPPWTDDRILQQYRFCNVRRRDDRVSRWLQKRVLTDKYIAADLSSFLLFTALCRWINWPPSIEAIMKAGLWPVSADKLNFKAIGKLLDAREQKTWTGAYMIRAEAVKDGAKGAFIAEQVVGQLRPRIGELVVKVGVGNKHNCWEWLCGHYSWGSFLAGQVVDDWTWTPLLRRANDLNTWAPIGPGSARGFNRMLGRPLKQPVFEEEFLHELQALRLLILEVLGHPERDVTLMDTQNVLCEFDKYTRVKNGEGRPRSTYKPETAFQA